MPNRAYGIKYNPASDDVPFEKTANIPNLEPKIPINVGNHLTILALKIIFIFFIQSIIAEPLILFKQ